mgnify:CR=1 FL=1
MVRGLQQISLIGELRQSGFTLLELMLVVLLLGLVGSVVSIALPSTNSKTALQVAGEVKQFFRLAQQRAVFSSQDVGVSQTHNGFEILYLSDSGWENEEKVKSFKVTSDVSVYLRVDGVRVQAQSTQHNLHVLPHVVFFSDGQYSLFDISVEASSGVAVFRELYGDIEESTIRYEH